MEPATEQYGSPAPNWAPSAPTAPPAGYGAPAAPSAPRARIGVIVLTALLMEVLLIGAGANQWVTDKILRDQSGGQRSRLIEDSWLTYTWRFSPQRHLTQHYVAQMLLIACVLVLSAALIWCLLRGPVTWGRAFFGTWLAVVGATLVGAIVRGLVDPFAKFSLPGTDRVTRAFFGASGPSSLVVSGALALGLVVALITSIVAVASRRPATTAPAPEQPLGPPAFADYAPPPPSGPGALPPWQDQHYGPPAPAPAAAPSLAKDAPGEPTTQLPRLPEEPPAGERPPAGAPADQATTQLPPPPPAGAEPPRAPGSEGATGDQPTTQLPVMPATVRPTQPPAEPTQPATPSPPPADQATSRFPRPPDDEDLGHIEH